MNPNLYAQTAKVILKKNNYCVIATSTVNGEPWISPMYFQHDEKYVIYWISAKDCRHTRLIENNPRVAITIFDSHVSEGKGNAVYIVGSALEVDDKELSHAVQVMYQKKTYKRNPFDFSGQSPRRIYKAVIGKMWVLGDPVNVSGYLLDYRIEINVRDL